MQYGLWHFTWSCEQTVPISWKVLSGLAHHLEEGTTVEVDQNPPAEAEPAQAHGCLHRAAFSRYQKTLF